MGDALPAIITPATKGTNHVMPVLIWHPVHLWIALKTILGMLNRHINAWVNQLNQPFNSVNHPTHSNLQNLL
jgi:hypothetical protein